MTNLVLASSIFRHIDEAELPLSPAACDYLRALYTLSEVNAGPVTTSRLAERLDVRPASATAMLQKLAAAEPPLVSYHKSRGAELTGAGRRTALVLVRCHRLLELFLHEKLGYGWDEVHAEADRLQPGVSAALADRLAEALGQPTHDPHGHAIPAADLSLPEAEALPLYDLPGGARTVIVRVSDDDPSLLRLMDELGLRPGAAVIALGAPTSGTMREVQVSDRPATAVPDAVARRVFVAPGQTLYPTNTGDWETQ